MCLLPLVSWTYLAEIFPLHMRAKAISLSTATNWTFNCVLGRALLSEVIESLCVASLLRNPFFGIAARHRQQCDTPAVRYRRLHPYIPFVYYPLSDFQFAFFIHNIYVSPLYS
jgi:hypothetical protein